jgi:hypothetical protein
MAGGFDALIFRDSGACGLQGSLPQFEDSRDGQSTMLSYLKLRPCCAHATPRIFLRFSAFEANRLVRFRLKL